MGKKVYTINGKMYIINDDTGKIWRIDIKDDPIPQEDLNGLIKLRLYASPYRSVLPGVIAFIYLQDFLCSPCGVQFLYPQYFHAYRFRYAVAVG